MRNSKRIQAAVLMASVFSLAAGVVPANAQGSDTTTANLTITAGTLTIEAPAAVSLGTLNVTAADQTATGTTGNVIITDLRGSNAGWSATANITHFTGQTTATDILPIYCGATSTNYFTMTGGALEVVPAAAGSLTGLTDYTTGQDVSSVSDYTSAGVSNTMNIASFSVGNGAGSYQKTVTDALTIAAYLDYSACTDLSATALTAQGYSATQTFSVA